MESTLIKPEIVLHTEAFRIWEWAQVSYDTECVPIEIGHLARMSIQVQGDFGSNGRILVLGALSRDPKWLTTLHDASGLSIMITENTLLSIVDPVWIVCPKVMGNGVSVDIRLMEGVW